MDRFTGFLRTSGEGGKNAALELPVLWQQDLRFTSRVRFVLSAALEIPKRPRLGKQCPVTGGIVVALRQETPMPILSCGSQRAHLLGLRPAVWRGRHHVVNVSIRQNAAVLSVFPNCFLFFSPGASPRCSRQRRQYAFSFSDQARGRTRVCYDRDGAAGPISYKLRANPMTATASWADSPSELVISRNDPS